MLRFVLSVALALVFSTSASSAWNVDVNGPDVFGKTTVFAAEIVGTEGLFVRCTSDGEFEFGLLVADDYKLEDLVFLEGELLIRVDGGATAEYSVAAYPWNNTYYSIQVEGIEEHFSRIVRELGDAQRRIDVGLNLFGQQFTAEFGVRGSTAAMQEVTEHCPSPNA